jgi:glycosyltransferase involved in cell wall biosynthesis
MGDFELLISDNGSTDGTAEICRRAERDRRVRVSRVATNRGAAWNYNHVLATATGAHFKWAADDDLCQPSFLSRCLEELEAHSEAVLAWPQTTIIDGDGATIGQMDDGNLDLRGRDAADRVGALLRNRVEWHPVFGVIRIGALRQTRGIGTFVSADIAVLAELALRGQFHQVPERLFLRRYHERRSIAANPSFREHAAWYQPDRRDRPVFPEARLVRELLVRVAEAPLPVNDRAQAAVEVLRRRALPHWRHIGGEVKLAMREAVGGLRRPGPGAPA